LIKSFYALQVYVLVFGFRVYVYFALQVFDEVFE